MQQANNGLWELLRTKEVNICVAKQYVITYKTSRIFRFQIYAGISPEILQFLNILKK